MLRRGTLALLLIGSFALAGCKLFGGVADGLYLDNELLLKAKSPTAFKQELVLAKGAHTLTVKGDAGTSFVLEGTVKGEGTLTVALGPSDKVAFTGPVRIEETSVVAGVADFTRTDLRPGTLQVRDGGTALRRLTPADLPGMRLWLNGANAETFVTTPGDDEPNMGTTDAGAIVYRWVNLVDANNPAVLLTGLPLRVPGENALTLKTSSMILKNLNLQEDVTLIAVVTTTNYSRGVPAIFSTRVTVTELFDRTESLPLVLSAPQVHDSLNDRVAAGSFEVGESRWVSSDPRPIELNKKYLLGAVRSDAGIALVYGGELVRNSKVPARHFPESKAPVFIGRRWDLPDYWDGKYFELIAGKGDQFVDELAGYAAWHNGLEGDLPKEHPYKSQPPTVKVTVAGSFVTLPDGGTLPVASANR